MISGCFAIVLGKAQTKAQGIQCMGNLRQLNQAGAEAFITINTPPLIGALDGFMGFANGQFVFRIGGLPGQVVILETSVEVFGNDRNSPRRTEEPEAAQPQPKVGGPIPRRRERP